MKNSLLFLRSFGDFVIALSVLSKSNAHATCRFIASDHLEPLYKAILNRLPNLSIKVEFEHLFIRRKILGVFTNKHLLDLHSLKELRILKELTNNLAVESTVFLEQERRLWLISLFMHKPHFIHGKGNIYDSYCKQFDVAPQSLLFNASLVPSKKVIIFPESRKPSKAFTPGFVQLLVQQYKDKKIDVEVAFFRKQPYPLDATVKIHDAFDDLLHLIETADEVLTADSLPAHLAQLLSKPHKVLYPKAVDLEWLTPYCSANQAFGIMNTHS